MCLFMQIYLRKVWIVMSGKVLKWKDSWEIRSVLLLSPVDVIQFVLKLGGRGRRYCNGIEVLQVNMDMSLLLYILVFNRLAYLRLKLLWKGVDFPVLKFRVCLKPWAFATQREQLGRQMNCLGIETRKPRQTQFLTV